MGILFSDFEMIYSNGNISIGKLGGNTYYSYYLITMSESIVSKSIGIKISERDVYDIVDSQGNLEVITRIKNSYNGYVEID